MLGTVLLLVVALVFAVVLARSVVLVGEGEQRVVLRLGKPHRTIGPGLHLLVPVVDLAGSRFGDGPQQVALRMRVAARDGTPLDVEAIVEFRVTSHVDAVTAPVEGLEQSLERLVGEATTGVVSSLEHDVARVRGAGLVRDAIDGHLARAAGAWGIVVDRVEVPVVEHVR